MTDANHRLFAEALQAARTDDGFGPRAGAASEPEPTALASIALDDASARAWLERNQRADGGFALEAGPVVNDAATGLCALALGSGTARERALDHVMVTRARTIASSEDAPHDPNVLGWAWTNGTFGWVEPTSHALLALQALRPDAASEQIADGRGLLADRECDGGGWNYGNTIVLGVALEPYAQTTGIALVALQDADTALAQRGLAALRRLWPKERGGLSLALSLAAFKIAGEPDAMDTENALVDEYMKNGFLGDVVTLAWAALSTGPGLELLRRVA